MTDLREYRSNKEKYLFKFREWSNPNHQAILKDKSIYIPSPKEFDDTLDCQLKEKFPDNKADVFSCIKEILRRNNPHWSEEALNEIASRLSETSILSDINETHKINQEWLSWFLEHVGILSVTQNIDNQYLWDKYADNGKGFCLVFDKQRLVSYFRTFGPVLYYEQLPELQPFNHDIDNYIKRFFAKGKDPYAKEEEFRMVKIWEDIPKNRMLNVYDCLLAVIAGPSMQDNDYCCLQTLVKENIPKVDVIHF